jgi:hypothetical protein
MINETRLKLLEEDELKALILLVHERRSLKPRMRNVLMDSNVLRQVAGSVKEFG